METSVSVKGQVLIPAEIRYRLGIKKGTKLSVEERNGEIVLFPLNRDYSQRISGTLKGAGLLETLQESRAEDLQREEDKVGRSKGSG